MSEHIRIERDGKVGLICLATPPVNALGIDLRRAVSNGLQTLLDDAIVEAIVIYGAGRIFSAGADIKDFARAFEKPTLPDLLKTLNDSPKPTIAVMHGIAYGGALELALATHLRVGVAGLKIGLPEVKLGLLPGAGGTQRLPRLIGIAPALDMICRGRDLSDAEALSLGILTRIEQGKAREIGLQAARDVLEGKLQAQQTDSLGVAADPATLEGARNRFTGELPAPLKAIDAIEASTLPIDEGLSMERALFLQLMESPEREGLVHAFIAERATAKIPEATATPRPLSQIGVVGGGTMGVGIATALLLAGLDVTLIEAAADRVETARNAVKANLTGAQKRGKLTAARHSEALTKLTATDDLTALATADLVVEAIFENLDAKTALFRDLDQICKPGAILATNTSYLDVNAIAYATGRPADVIGLHFFSPAHIMRLLEIVVADKTAPEVTATSLIFAKNLHKIPVRSGVCEGFIGNRILTRYRKLSEYLVLDGAGFDQVDHALERFGFAMGPFAVSDLAGLDIAKANRDRTAATRPEQERHSRVADLICENGWLGRKTARGYYLYDQGTKTGPNPGVREIVEAERKKLGITAQNFTDQEIVDRILTAMIQEAAMILQEGIALRPIDIDAVQLFGYGFPRHHGGPMHLADRIGNRAIIDRIETYAKEDAYFWRVPELLHEMARNNQRFDDLNAKAM